jgi:hypothetical protein
MANLKSFTSIIILALSLLIATPLRAGVPTEQIRTTVKKILDILNDPQRKSEERKEDWRNLLHRTTKPDSISQKWQRIPWAPISGSKDSSINYKAHLVDGDWKDYDIVADNISVVNNCRSQFNRTIRKSSNKDLIRKLEERRRIRPTHSSPGSRQWFIA